MTNSTPRKCSYTIDLLQLAPIARKHEQNIRLMHYGDQSAWTNNWSEWKRWHGRRNTENKRWLPCVGR